MLKLLKSHPLDGVLFLLATLGEFAARVLAFGFRRLGLAELDHRAKSWRAAAYRTQIRYLYRCFSGLADDPEVTFLNYGYTSPESSTVTPPSDLELSDEANRLSIQLYHRVASAVELAGRDVAEISCGHGGGASYIARYLRPGRMVGVDLNLRAIDLCRRNIDVDTLTFEVGDATDLPFDDGTFDAVLNVEASHCYVPLGDFFDEVYRVLRPGGHLLLADLRWSQVEWNEFDAAVNGSQFDVVEREEITDGVVAALEAFEDRRRAIVGRLVPQAFAGLALAHFAVPGTPAFESFRTGEGRYVRYVLAKPEAGGAE